MLSLDMPLDIPTEPPTEPHKVLQAMVVMDMEVMAMVVTMARDLLSQDTMVVPALMFNRAVLTTMDLMAMVSTTMASGLLTAGYEVVAVDNFVNDVIDPTGETDYPESLLRVQKLTGKKCKFHNVDL